VTTSNQEKPDGAPCGCGKSTTTTEQSNPDTVPCCCEYYCDGGVEWFCVRANPPSGYYCPDSIAGVRGSCPSGVYSYFPPHPITNAQRSTDRPACGEFCTYQFHNNAWLLMKGHCGCGNYCPTNLMAYLKAHSPDLHQFLNTHPGIVQAISIHPGSIAECRHKCGGGHHDEALEPH
jgi:hypothetical protein